MEYQNLVKFITENNGIINPLFISSELTNGTGLCNPSLLYSDNKLKMILRHVEYTLFCAEGEKKFYSKFEGPLSYYHRDDDLKLRTNNYYGEIDIDTLEINNIQKINTSKLDKTPIWNFIGLEDARLVNWNNKYYACGVRRDTNTNGVGRIEFSELEFTEDNKVIEIARNRIEVEDKKSYCEKNWMPIKDKPFHFIKWTNPTEIVKVDLNENKATHVYLSDKLIDLDYDLRGGSHLIKWKDNYIAIVHECKFTPKNTNNYKDAEYFHRFVVWNNDFEIKKISKPFNFMTGKIEFCIGFEIIENYVYIAFSFQDNGSFIIKFGINLLNTIVDELLI